MNIIHGNSRDGSDPELQQALASHYAVARDDAYWTNLEQRIMDRVRRESAREWWSWFPGWVRYGLAAAAGAAILSGVVSWQTRVTQERIAYRELFDAPTEVPVLSERTTPVDRDREHTLRYLLTR